jgi:hypothetical protein
MQKTLDIIKLLPFEEKFKEDLLASFDKLTDDQRYSIENVIWEFYDALYEMRLKTNMEAAFERAKKKEEKLDHEFYLRIRKQTEQELMQEFSSTETAVDLSETREQLQEILKNNTSN